ncbi:hypothetical protein BDK51DRAFT_47778 [Blyttiomyces helicus]|uniref:Uncharacterized protein n=1 Tax=Blyttiomyces helicus TaxID=388810 RepID=A0A4P9WFE5_9FUNG|nr:hypothetical protein BDK51DRAFT_47778 [Blyttiomyces helicus]|eukprot:RKO91469.1 hypothetical protein BDK51DRAFT_47778 [Blyttiomyces helicus]
MVTELQNARLAHEALAACHTETVERLAAMNEQITAAHVASEVTAEGLAVVMKEADRLGKNVNVAREEKEKREADCEDDPLAVKTDGLFGGDECGWRSDELDETTDSSSAPPLSLPPAESTSDASSKTAALSDCVPALRQRLGYAGTQVSTLSEKLRIACNQLLALQASAKAQSAAELQLVSERRDALAGELSTVRAQAAGLEQELAIDCAKTRAAHVEELCVVLQRHADASAQVAALMGKLAGANGQVAAPTGELAGANAQVAALTGELAGGNPQVAALTEDLADANAQVATFTGELTGVNAQVAALRGDLADANVHAAVLDSKLRAVSVSEQREKLERSAKMSASAHAKQLNFLREERNNLLLHVIKGKALPVYVKGLEVHYGHKPEEGVPGGPNRPANALYSITTSHASQAGRRFDLYMVDREMSGKSNVGSHTGDKYRTDHVSTVGRKRELLASTAPVADRVQRLRHQLTQVAQQLTRRLLHGRCRPSSFPATLLFSHPPLPFPDPRRFAHPALQSLSKPQFPRVTTIVRHAREQICARFESLVRTALVKMCHITLLAGHRSSLQRVVPQIRRCSPCMRQCGTSLVGVTRAGRSVALATNACCRIFNQPSHNHKCFGHRVPKADQGEEPVWAIAADVAVVPAPVQHGEAPELRAAVE